MSRQCIVAAGFVLLLGSFSFCAAGPYSGPQDDPANTIDPGVPGFVDGKVNPVFVAWATGFVDYLPTPGVDETWQTPERVLGPVTGQNTDMVSLGDLDQDQIAQGVAPGRITLTFRTKITNGPGADFAVFENGYVWGGLFAELGYVEVSSNGRDFARFPSVSLTPEPVGPYGVIDATGVFNLAGKHANAFGTSMGTPFDLRDLAGDPLVADGTLDLGAVGYVRIVDIPGSGDFLDGHDRPIYDAWPTRGSGGLDLEAIGVIHGVPEPGGLVLLGGLALAVVRSFARRCRNRPE